MEFFEYLLSTYGYFAIFVILVGGIIGLPIPDEVLLAFIGFYIYKGKLTFILSIITAYTGSVIGISISYYLGYKLGLPFLQKYGPKIGITHKKVEKTQKLFEKYGAVLLFIGYFLPGIRHITGYLAGISRYSLRKFALFAFSGAFFWVIFFISLGHQAGYRWYLIEEYIIKYSIYGLLLFFITVVLIWLYYRKKQKKQQQSS
ncbi:DedA family protein [Bacillus alkalicellulosilyticus]|uniref:DedA family protein n=1 Tax=Alkalihalobacterium alkalicellulosilyticum TaxID=1912214 RepID=UPI001115F22F|nr:DedA family protein [Bacillus alkalicellulosilyticus]